MLPLPVLEPVSQRSGQPHTSVARDVFPIANATPREEEALIDGHVRVLGELGRQHTYRARGAEVNRIQS